MMVRPSPCLLSPRGAGRAPRQTPDIRTIVSI